MAEPRRFPPPWSVEETAPCFIVRDANGQAQLIWIKAIKSNLSLLIQSSFGGR
jgi:hypothetical protein